MKKLVGLKALVAIAIVAMMPSFANANLIGWTGSLAPGDVDIYPFAVTTAGDFRVSAIAGFLVAIATNVGGFDDGNYAATFDISLGVGNYLVGIKNEGPASCNHCDYYSEDYALGINTRILHRGELAYVPEPGSLMLLGTGLLGLVALRRRRQSA